MTLITTATATLGQLQYTEQLRSVRAHLTLLPGVNRVQLAIAAGVRVDAVPGDDAEVSLDGGDGAATLITGRVTAVRRDAQATVVTVADAGAALAAIRPIDSYHGLPLLQVVGKLADLAEVSTGLVLLLGQTADWVPRAGRTGAEQVAELADLGGGVAHIDAAGRLAVAAWPIGIPDAAMRLDREFLACAVHTQAPGRVEVPIGVGGAGNALSPDAWLPATDALATGDDADATHSWRVRHALRALTDVQIATDAADRRLAASTRRLEATCWPQPARRPGDVVQIQQGDDQQAGPWLLTHVRHTVDAHTATSTLLGVTAGAGALGLLEGAAAAIGGAL